MRDTPLVFIFDFDGVIVDALPALYRAYRTFLESQGFSGNLDEFERLSSPVLAEIVTVLKKKYQLDDRHDSLLRHYHKQMSEAYRCAQLNEYIREILAYLRDRQCHIALASSSKRYIVEGVLKYYKLDNFFDFVLTCDDVSEVKPSPEIYNKLKAHYPGSIIYAIEGKVDGIMAAQAAGLKTILFRSQEQQIDAFTHYEIESLMQIKRILEEHRLNCFTIGVSQSVSLSIGSYTPAIPDALLRKVNIIWEDDKDTYQLENDTVICYRSHKKSQGKLLIEGFVTEFKYIYAQRHSPDLDLNLYPIRICGVVTDNNNHVLVGVKDLTTDYAGCRKLIPTGKAHTRNIQSGRFNIKQEAIEALGNEIGISAKNVLKIDPRCFIYDNNERVYKIASLIHVKVSIETLIDELVAQPIKHGFKSLDIIALGDSANEITPYVPASKVLLNALQVEGRL